MLHVGSVPGQNPPNCTSQQQKLAEAYEKLTKVLEVCVGQGVGGVGQGVGGVGQGIGGVG